MAVACCFSFKSIYIISFILSSKNVFGQFCRLPNGNTGSYMLLNDCEILKKVIPLEREDEDIRNYLNQVKYRDTSGVPRVCCPSRDDQDLKEILKKIDKILQTKLLKPETGYCGRKINIASRIMGGNETIPGEFPWHVLLVYNKPFYRIGYHCGGSLITSTHVVTAAHCTASKILPKTWNVTKVRLGRNDLRSITDCMKEQEQGNSNQSEPCAIEVFIQKIITHELYNTQQGSPNDIAIIKLTQKVQYTSYVMPICLPVTKIINTEYGSGVIAGFGKTESSESSYKLLKAEISLVNRQDCISKYMKFKRSIQSSQICAAGSHSDSCNGDSGGGFIMQDNTSTSWFLVGIISFGPRTCNSGIPGVYVKVSDYISWIENKIQD